VFGLLSSLQEPAGSNPVEAQGNKAVAEQGYGKQGQDSTVDSLDRTAHMQLLLSNNIQHKLSI
jgi:hypothetical protein